VIYKILNKCGKSIRGRSFELDKRVPISYLINFGATLVFDYLRWLLSFGLNRNRIFVGRGGSLLCKSKFFFKGKNVKFAKNCYIDALSLNGVVFGDNVSVQKNVSIECTGSISEIGVGLVLGDNVGIGSHSFLGCAGGIVIGGDTIIGNFVSFHSENHNFDDPNTPIRLQGVSRKGIVIGKNCWIGAKVTILDGTVVGDGCVIAGGAVLTGIAYPSGVVIAGVPGRVLKDVCG